MTTHAASGAFQPPRKEKSKPGVDNSSHLVVEVSGSAGTRASGAGKSCRKTKPTSSARRRHGHTNHPAVRREEARRAALKKSHKPPPKRGDVKIAIFKDFADATWGFLCASPTVTRDTDAFLDSVPSPKKSQPMAKLWPLMDEPMLQEFERK